MRVALVTKAMFLVACATLLALPSVAGAVLSGANGRIVYISGRGYGQNAAQVYTRISGGSLGVVGNLNTGPLALAETQQHRHPTWSPDRTKIAYARGDASCVTNCDIYVLDLTAPALFAQNLTKTADVTEDRPAWSPDGKSIAYESEVTDGSNQTDILVDPVGEGATVNLTATPGIKENKPAWTPDSQTIYYAYNDNADIRKEPADNSQANGTPVLNSGEGEFQPSISPDGTKMCYTRGANFNSNADIYVVNSDGSGAPGFDLSDNPGVADYNCTWSPTGLLIAYVRGLTTDGDLYVEEADDTGFPLGLEKVSGAFDGNPDWAPDGRPVCQDLTVSTGFNQPVAIPLNCRDTGPFYERTETFEFISELKPANGTLNEEEVEQGEDPEPSTVIYTPNPGFSGTDKFEYSGFDQIAGFAEEAKIVTVKVAAPPQAADEPPVVSNLTVKPQRWRLGKKLPKISAVKVGAKIRWRLSEAASTKLTFQRALKGRRVGKRCVKQTPQNASKPRCTRFQNASSREFANGKAGFNTLAFQGRVTRKRRLSPGRYRVMAQATDSAGQLSKVVFSKPFTIVGG